MAVLACGIDRAYPLANAHLLSAIGRTGSIVTELPPGSASIVRASSSATCLIAAITGGVIVVEAALRSGSLQTAGRAADLGGPGGCLGPVTPVASAGVIRRSATSSPPPPMRPSGRNRRRPGRDATVSPWS